MGDSSLLNTSCGFNRVSCKRSPKLHQYTLDKLTLWLSALHLGHSFSKAMAIRLTSETAPARLSDPFTNWLIMM